MKSRLILILVGMLFIVQLSFTQTKKSGTFRNFPIIITIQFHSLAMPFRDLKYNFRNIGIGVGTEVSYNGQHNWAQQLHAVWYRNRAAGNGLLFYTQAAWRPYLLADSYGELKAGLGYLISFRPSESFVQQNGEWISAGKKGKGLLVVLAGTSLGYHSYSISSYVSPFVSYQVMLLKDYSKDLPVMPESLIQTGISIHPVYSVNHEN